MARDTNHLERLSPPFLKKKSLSFDIQTGQPPQISPLTYMYRFSMGTVGSADRTCQLYF
jgi:hypothetical protein